MGQLMCAVCGRGGRPYGKPCTLAGCCPYIRLDEHGHVFTFYFGFVHQKCLKPHWKKEVDNAVKQGWLVPAEKKGTFRPAPQYGGLVKVS